MKIGDMKPGDKVYVSANAITESTDQEKVPGHFISKFTEGHAKRGLRHRILVEKLVDGSLVATVSKRFSARKMQITPRLNRPNLLVQLKRK